MYKGLIQVCLYGYILSKELKIDLDTIECLIYNSETALKFSPLILHDVLKFIEKLNKLRKERLIISTKKQDLGEEIKVFLQS